MKTLYRESLALLTDLYQLTMAYAYWKNQIADKEAVFHLFFRKRPFNGAFAIAAGLEVAIDFIRKFKFDASDLAYLETLKLFDKAFLDYLASFSFTCDIDAMPEGTVAFPQQPLLRVQGPIIQAQLLESPLLNLINFPTLIATKASRICWAAKPDPIVEFGLRRAQGVDGAITASRAAYIGGCEFSSNVLAGKLFGIPIKGTHAHSWIMAFNGEEESFEAFAEVMPNDCIFLVDTYNTIEGVKKAIRVAKRTKIDMLGVRLDSGDLACLSIQIRKMLDDAGFPNAKIMASNELDEHIISDLKHQGSKINIWGVGTNLVTGKDQPALDGVYKLSAIREKGGKWQHKIKISETTAKVTNPGILQVRRYFDKNGNLVDMLYNLDAPVPKKPMLIDYTDPILRKQVQEGWSHMELLVPIMRKGKIVYKFPALKQIQKNTFANLEKFSPSTRRFLFPQTYFAGMEKSLYDLKAKLIGKT